MASSSSRSRKGHDAVLENVSPVLRERLGPEATVGLLALFEAARQDWASEVNEHSSLRFERLLTEEAAQLRVDFREGLGRLRLEMKGDMAILESGVQRALLVQTRWIFGMWVGQLAATAAMIAAMFQIFAQ
jgi:hypothetical protein